MSQKPNTPQGPDPDPLQDSSAGPVDMSDEDMKALDEEVDTDDDDTGGTTTWKPKRGPKTKAMAWIIIAAVAICVIGLIIALMIH